MIFSGRPLRRLAGAISRLKGEGDVEEEEKKEEDEEEEEKEEDRQGSVSYTHLTLPAKRIV